jgi:amidase
MDLSEYAQYDGLGLADLVRRGEVKSSDLVGLALSAIEQVNPQINAVICPIVRRDDEVDENHLPDGPFAGVPFLIKDIGIHAAGIPADCGSRLLQNIVHSYDTELMSRFKKAGLITIGRTNTPEMGMNVSTEPLLHGPSRNPWNAAKTTGGSSGGSAAAVAARIVPWAHANDGAGSIRIPASCCGVVGLKPTRGRVSEDPDFGEVLLGLGINFAVTRSVRDSAAMLDAVQGPGVGDPYVIPPPVRPYLEEVSTPPGNLRIAFTTAGWNGTASDHKCARAVEDAAQLLESLGHTVVQAAPTIDFDALVNACVPTWCGFATGAIEHARHTQGRNPSPDNLEATTWACYQFGLNSMSGLEVVNALAEFNRLNRSMGAFMRDFDILLCPTLPTPPVELGVYDANDASLDAKGWIDKIYQGFALFTGLFNVTGQPALSLPLHQTDDGSPIGVQLAGRFGDEAALFRLAGQLERASPWIDRKPGISV